MKMFELNELSVRYSPSVWVLVCLCQCFLFGFGMGLFC